MSQVLTLRLPEATAEAMRQIARREKRSLNDVGVRIVEEWLRQNRFAHIEFRSFNGERHACIKDRLQVWQIIMVAKDYEMDAVLTASHLDLTQEQVQSAFSYYEAFPEEIEQALEDNAMGYERLKEMLPSLQKIEVRITEEV